MPKYAVLFMLFTLGSVGLPGTSGFVGEFLALLGAFQVNTIVAALAASGVVLGAAYMLVLYRRVIFGAPAHADAASMPDLDRRELGMLALLAFFVLWLGVFPSEITSRISPSVDKLLADYHVRLEHPLSEVQGEETP
jgi:NADH-quinone oxidoreductase subunit M